MEKRFKEVIKKFLDKAADLSKYDDEVRVRAAVDYAGSACNLYETLKKWEQPKVKSKE